MEQASKLFGAHHYRDYHFLSVSAITSRTSDLSITSPTIVALTSAALVDDTARKLAAGLLPHEYVHSWNGKYRRPADLATPDYQQPMQDDLLWVYEGLTKYLGTVLTARSGLLTADQDATISREPRLHSITVPDVPGAICKTQPTPRLQLYFAPQAWHSWRAAVDFYAEDTLNWLWVDTIIRQQSKARRPSTISVIFSMVRPAAARHDKDLHLR